MRFGPRLSVGARLTMTMLVVVVLTWALGGAVVFQLMRLDVLRPGPRPVTGVGIHEGLPPHDGEPDLSPMSLEQPGDDEQPPSPEGGGEQGPPLPRRSFWRGPGWVNLLVGLFLSVAAGVWLSRRFTRPLATLLQGAQELERGRLDSRIALAGDDEFVRVATSMNHMAERISEQIHELEEDSRRRQHLLADVAHELRSPVASLKTMAEALRDGVAAGPDRSERATAAVLESAEHLDRLVTDLLELARLDLHELPLHPQVLDLRALVADSLRRYRPAADQASITIAPAEEGPPVMISGDPHRLGQVLDNLLDNAISHAGGGAEVRVTVTPGDPAVLTVADTGRGIAAEHLPYLFDAFYRGDAARTPGDHHSGLGLRIARGLVEAHGGDLRVESVEGHGTRAVITLPRAPANG